MIKDNLALVGKIASTHGIKGELKIIWFTDTNEIDIKTNDFAFIELGSTIEPLKIKQLTDLYIKKPLVLFEGYESINLAQKLIGKDIYIKNELVTKLQDETCMGFEAIFKEQVGKVIDFLDNSIYITYKVEFEEKTIWIPSVDEYVEEIDFDNETIILKNIERLT
ncbi:ribosome maturation factor RimM [Spiroplasma endosymbiont of Othius punctulatus]|uniref:ribosome maturation factor RimM n=1 Tax=Spiroplasma endosymbiont of Othius punctulatus TaxID=3066289 RepID=UPI0030CAB65E